MEKEELLNSDFFKKFKSEEELTGFLKEMHSRGLEKMLEAEMDVHLGYEKHSTEGNNSGNSRNGLTSKTLKTEYGEAEIKIPRDRNSTFSPVIVPKHQNKSISVQNIVISLYAKGMSVSDIEDELREIYGFRLSTSAISTITAKVTQDIIDWQKRPLESLYFIVWMDGIVFKVRDNGKVVNKTIYLAVGLNQEGHKELLGIWLGKNESASFWLGVLTDIKARGTQDILIPVTDNLNGFTEAIKGVFPRSNTQICVVHQIRNSSKYVVWKDKKAFAADMKNIYNAPTKQAASQELEVFEQNWGSKYPYAIKSWKENWNELTVFFDFPLEIRRIIYTTNLIENINGRIRKYTKNKLSFPNDEAVMKSTYLALDQITSKWTQPIHNWGIVLNQFMAIFENRVQI
jgi:putative transposase